MTQLGEAHAFGRALAASMRRRGASQGTLARAIGTSQAAVYHYLRGTHLPTLVVADRMAEALMDEGLVMLACQLRTRRCALASCGRAFTQSSGAPALYCGAACRNLARKGVSVQRPESDERRAIARMCRGCEPTGVCRTAECPLRAFSPLPMVRAETVALAEAARSSRKSEATRARDSEVMRARWADPTERERMMGAMRAGIEAMSPGAKEARRRRISEARRRRAA